MTKPLRTLAYWRRHQKEKCNCGGYHFPHRRGGGACYHGARCEYYLALRQGLSEEEALALLPADQLERMP